MNVLIAILFSAVLLTQPQPPAKPEGFLTPRVFLPLVVQDESWPPRIERIDVIDPGIWVWWEQTCDDFVLYHHAYIFNPEHPGGLWTVFGEVDPDDDKWFHIRRRLEWPGWWHEQRQFELVGTCYQVTAVVRDTP